MVFLLCLRLLVRVGWRWVPENSCEPEKHTTGFYHSTPMVLNETTKLTFWRRNYFLNFRTPCI